jgi:hypothetical protein
VIQFGVPVFDKPKSHLQPNDIIFKF